MIIIIVRMFWAWTIVLMTVSSSLLLWLTTVNSWSWMIQPLPLPSSSLLSRQQQRLLRRHDQIALFDPWVVQQHTFHTIYTTVHVLGSSSSSSSNTNSEEVVLPENGDENMDTTIISPLSTLDDDKDESSYIPIPMSSSTTMMKSSKADLYSNEELMNLFQIHQSIIISTTTTTLTTTTTNTTNKGDTTTTTTTTTPSLQDLIVQTLQDIEPTTTTTVADTNNNINNENDALLFQTKTPKFHTSLSQNELIQKVRQIRAIVSDVDGTLLGNRNHQLHPYTKRAIQNVMEATLSPIHQRSLQYFFLATGKTKMGAMNSLGIPISTVLQHCPGVYVQGLYCLDGNGNVIFEKKLSNTVIQQMETFVNTQRQQNITLLAYDGDVIYYNPHQSHVIQHITDVHTKWGEPLPIPICDGTTTTAKTTLSTYPPAFHKLLLMGDDPIIMSNHIRPLLETLVSSLSCVITQAIPTMLEVLPKGCSKAYGVQQVCDYYGIDTTTQLCTIGDAENDIGMIQMASLGIAVGNAISSVKDIADIVMDDTSTDGAAGQAMELFGLGTILDQIELNQ